MEGIFIISNILYSKNDFLIKKLFDLIGNDISKDKIRKTIINVKYWYSSMPDEFKSIFLKVIENRTFEVYEGLYIKNESLRLRSHCINLKNNYYWDQNSDKENKAVSFTEALQYKKLEIPECKENEAFTLIDYKNNFIFKVLSNSISMISEFGTDILELKSNPRHSLLIYAAAKSIKTMEANCKAMQKLKDDEDMKNSIIRAYNESMDKKA